MSAFGSGRRVHSVAELANRVRSTLDGAFDAVWVQGELSNFRAYPSGHWYFTLKDEIAQLRGVMFARQNREVGFKPKDGDEVLLLGRVDLYTKRGDLQIIGGQMEPVGAGRLQKQFEELKARLAAEGLFDRDRKKPLPRVPRRIGIVTSERAAALQDMLRVLAKRDLGLSITLSPCRVQGEQAGSEIAGALELLARHGGIEVILCGRGGGSLEDLWAFNEEIVARAIAACPIPVISGVGHETDLVIADLVADARAPTPTAAAEMAVPIRSELEGAVAELRLRLHQAALRGLRGRRERLSNLGGRLESPQRRLDRMAQQLDDAQERIVRAMTGKTARGWERLGSSTGRMLAALPPQIRSKRQQLEARRSTLLALGPLQSLERGYALAFREGQLLRRAEEVSVGDAVRLRLGRGSLGCRVEDVVPDDGTLRPPRGVKS